LLWRIFPDFFKLFKESETAVVVTNPIPVKKKYSDLRIFTAGEIPSVDIYVECRYCGEKRVFLKGEKISPCYKCREKTYRLVFTV
jgi:DNA-directed RNA polymerase subunit RPC12/RpoP